MSRSNQSLSPVGITCLVVGGCHPMLEDKTHRIYDEFLGIHAIQKMFAGDTKSFNSFLDELPFCLWIHDDNFTIIHTNRAFKQQFGSCQTKRCHQQLMGSPTTCNCCLSKKAFCTKQAQFCKSCKRGHRGYDLNIFHIPIINDRGDKIIVKSSMHFDERSVETFMLDKYNFDSNLVS